MAIVVSAETLNATPALRPSLLRPQVRGKFLFVGDEKFYIHGVTYGTFQTNEDGDELYDPAVVEHDLLQMAASGFNTVRTYTLPPLWFLDLAGEHGLWVMAGLPWEQHLCILDDRYKTSQIRCRLRKEVCARAGHPAILAYTVGNEIPASIVRWHGSRCVERFLARLYHDVKAEDPEALITYVNYPTTEYLDLPFLDFASFNVYLESQEQLQAYLARLQNLAGERPLIMAEIGLDSRRHGEEAQAHALDWQLRTAFASGCAGAFVFAWTDEWHRGGYAIDDWDFGLTHRNRQPKPALTVVQKAIAETPFLTDLPWPRISVVVCSYNGSRTIRDCLEGLLELPYPNYEVIVVDDGSKDKTAAIAGEFDVHLISTENRGLSNARNTGMEAASGEIIAYIDDDARPDPHWLHYLAHTFMCSTHAAVGGPNISPPSDGVIANCVDNAPGNPIHVLLTDQIAEHLPGCNVAVRKEQLQAIGGFDPQFRVAGDDVDVCWRLQQQGWTLGFSPAAMVWHHRRNSLTAYWKQQIGYGKAEAMLAQKWPEKYNAEGHLTWIGRIYGKGLTQALVRPAVRIYHGTWGSAPFQSLYLSAPGKLASFMLMPEWYLLIFLLFMFTTLSPLWPPLGLALPLLLLTAAIPIAQVMLSASRASFAKPPTDWSEVLKLKGLVALLHLVQPAARLYGRLRHGLAPWRRYGGWILPKIRTFALWSEAWQEASAWLAALEAQLHRAGVPTLRGSNYDRWDLEIRGGALGTARVLMAIEEHGAGRQLVRFRIWPWLPPIVIAPILLFFSLSLGAALHGAWTASMILGAMSLPLVLYGIQDCGAAMAAMSRAFEPPKEEKP